MIIDSPIISGSYAASGSLNQFGNVTITGSLTVSGPIIGSITGSADSASFATTASYWSGSIVNAQSSSFAANAQNAVTASYLSNYIPPFPYTGSAGISGSLTVNGPITAQTLIVQTITSSEDFVTGSTRFGTIIDNTHQFTGSVSISGSLAVNGSNAVLTNQTSSMSVATASYWSGSINNVNSASFASTASYWSGSITNVLSASYALTASYASNVPLTASFADNATSASYALTASYWSGSIENAATASFVTLAQSASYWSGSITNAATASFVTTAQTASFVQNAQSASYWSGSITNATSASYALTASYISGSGGGVGFPFSGSAVITGSLLITELSGSGTKYVITDNNGLLSISSGSTAIKVTETITSTTNQTSFTVPNGYTTGLVDVFINGIKLNDAEFTDNDGVTITLATGSNDGDVVEFAKYQPANGVTNNALRQQTTFIADAGQTVFSASYTPGLLDIFYNGSRLSNSDYTANNGTYFTLATASAVNDILDVFVYSYQVGAFNGIGGTGVTSQIAYFNTTSSITGSNNFTINGSTMTVTGSLLVSGSGTFTNIGPAVLSGSVNISGSLAVGGANVVLSTQTSSLNVATASFAVTASSADNLLVRNTLTAQTLVVQTITSSVDFVTGSTRFGSISENTHVFTGSMSVSGSLSGSSAIFTSDIQLNGGTGTRTLTVQSNTSGDAVLQLLAAGSNGGNIAYKRSTSEIVFNNNSIDALKIGGTGAITFSNSFTTSDTPVLFLSPNLGTNQSIYLQLGKNISSTYNSGEFSFKYVGNGSSSNMVSLGFYGDGQKLNVLGNGNVGIGTTPSYRLDVNRGSSGVVLNLEGTNAYDAETGILMSAGRAKISGFLNTGGGTPGTSLRFYTMPDEGSVTERMRITSGGNLLLTSGVSTGVTDTRFLLVSQGTSSSTYAMVLKQSDNSTNLLYIRDDGSTYLKGKVGIGITNPESLLDVADSSSNTLMLVKNTSTANTTGKNAMYGFGGTDTVGTPKAVGGMQAVPNDVNWVNGLLYWYVRAGDGQALRMSLSSGGALVISGTLTQSGSPSDINLKENLVKISSPLEKISQINGYTFEWKEGSPARGNISNIVEDAGVVAQEIETILPEIVRTSDNNKVINYNGITALLIEAIKEQQTLITALQEKLERNNIN
jgi:hypothetical protein